MRRTARVASFVMFLLVTCAVRVHAQSGVPLCTVNAGIGDASGIRWSQYGGQLNVYFTDDRDDAGDIRGVTLWAGSYLNDILPADGPAVVVRPGLQWDVHAAPLENVSCPSQFSCTPTVIVYLDEVEDVSGTTQVIRAKRLYDVDWDVALSAPGGQSIRPRIVSDGAGGVFASWIDESGPTPQGRVQRVAGDGSVLWGPAGLPVAAPGGWQEFLDLIPDKQGGLYAVWSDNQGPAPSVLYATHMDASGNRGPGWPASGRLVSTAANAINSHRIAVDGSGGLYVAWTVDVQAPSGPIVSQPRLLRVMPDATIQPAWPLSGFPIVTLPDDHIILHDLQPDGLGGAVVAMTKNGGTFTRAVFSRVRGDASRPPGWAAAGLEGGILSVEQGTVRLIGQQGGLIGVWVQFSQGTPEGDIVGARFMTDGSRAPGWEAEGHVIGGGPEHQYDPIIVADATDGALVVWGQGVATDPTGTDLYGQTVNASGQLDVPDARRATRSLALSITSRNPSADGFDVSLELPSAALVRADVVDVAGRRIATVEHGDRPAGRHLLNWSGRREDGSPASAGVYFLRVHAGSGVKSLPLVVAR